MAVMISVVIPAYNEERALPGTLRRLLAEPGDYEVTVVDGGSEDATRAVASAVDGVQVMSAAKGRASQMNAGARSARGDWLLFLHADTLLPPGWLPAIRALDVANGVVGGGFRLRLSGDDWRLRLVSGFDNLRARVTGIMYGDQALFVRRSVFESLGGFPDQPLEDVAFGERLKRRGRVVLLEPMVVTDARKFIRLGVWRSVACCMSLVICHRLGLPLVGRGFLGDIR